MLRSVREVIGLHAQELFDDRSASEEEFPQDLQFLLSGGQNGLQFGALLPDIIPVFRGFRQDPLQGVIRRAVITLPEFGPVHPRTVGPDRERMVKTADDLQQHRGIDPLPDPFRRDLLLRPGLLLIQIVRPVDEGLPLPGRHLPETGEQKLSRGITLLRDQYLRRSQYLLGQLSVHIAHDLIDRSRLQAVQNAQIEAVVLARLRYIALLRVPLLSSRLLREREHLLQIADMGQIQGNKFPAVIGLAEEIAHLLHEASVIPDAQPVKT